MFQTIVDDLKAAKADGVLSDEEKAAIKAKALANLKSHLGVKGLKELLSVLGLDDASLDKFLSSKLEASLHDVKADPLL
jgi:hypothetical protein